MTADVRNLVIETNKEDDEFWDQWAKDAPLARDFYYTVTRERFIG